MENAFSLGHLLAALGVLATSSIVVVGYFQLRAIHRQIRNDHERKMRENSLNYSLTKNEIHRQARMQLEAVFGSALLNEDALPADSIYAKINENPGVETSIRTLLGHWENMALAIHVNVADEEVAYEMVAGSVITTVETYRPYIDRERRKNPRLYKYLTKLANIWRERRHGISKPNFSDFRIE